MTLLPPRAKSGDRKLGLVIDLDTCVGCHACAVNCKEWNTGGHSAPLPDHDPYGTDPNGVWFNRVHTFEAGKGTDSRTVHFLDRVYIAKMQPAFPCAPPVLPISGCKTGLF